MTKRGGMRRSNTTLQPAGGLVKGSISKSSKKKGSEEVAESRRSSQMPGRQGAQVRKDNGRGNGRLIAAAPMTLDARFAALQPLSPQRLGKVKVWISPPLKLSHQHDYSYGGRAAATGAADTHEHHNLIDVLIVYFFTLLFAA